MPPIALHLITGFLGSGKTTLLRHLLTQHGTERDLALINEFAARDFDGERVAEVAGEQRVYALPGGSLFCRCLSGRFVQNLQTLAEQRERGTLSFDRLWVEGSGIADPTALGTLLHEYGLERQYRLANILCVVDPGTLPKLVHSMPAAWQQLTAADLVVLNKTDLYDEPALAACEAIVARAGGNTPCVRAQHAAIPMALIPETDPDALARLNQDLPTAPDPRFYAARLDVPRAGMSRQQLDQLVSACGEGLLRLKGTVRVDGTLCVASCRAAAAA